MITLLKQRINQLWQADPRLDLKRQLFGKSLRIEVIDLFYSCELKFDPLELQLILQKNLEENADTTRQTVENLIRGNVPDLLNLFLKDPEHKSALLLSGDLHFLENFHRWFTGLEIDWEAILSEYTGDLLAHQLIKKWQYLKKKKYGSQFLSQGLEYFQEESQALPNKILAQQFMEDIDHLQNDVDRLEAKIAFLEQSHLDQSQKSLAES